VLLLLLLQVVPLMVVETRKEVDEVSQAASRQREGRRPAILLCAASSLRAVWY
jgi:hypothetical protein